MKIISHRGLWRVPSERNTLEAFEAAFEQGFGIETDVRDFQGKLVVSHDIASESAPSFDDLLELYGRMGGGAVLALNVKADGLQGLLSDALRKHGADNYFLFDMSVPEMIVYARKGLRVFTRQSEFERDPILYEASSGVWCDGFDADWIGESSVAGHLREGKIVGIVSPELHGRDKSPLWSKLKAMGLAGEDKVILCTDHPSDARRFFDERD